MEEDLQKERERLLGFGRTHTNLYIYGAGTYGKRYFDFFVNNHMSIHAFIVSQKHKEYYCDKKVYSINEVLNVLPDGAGIIPAFENAQVKKIREMFGTKKVDVLEVHHLLFLKMITDVRFQPILNQIELEYGVAHIQSVNYFFKTILVIRTDAIGDLICTVPFIRELRKNFPHSQITVVVRKSNRLIIERCPYVDEILFYNAELVDGEIYEQCEQLDDIKERVKAFAELNFQDKTYDAVFLPRELMAGRNILDDIMLALESGAKYRFGHIVNTDLMKPYIFHAMKKLFTFIAYTDRAMHEVMYQLSMLREIGCLIEDTKMELWVSKQESEAVECILKEKGLLSENYMVAVGFVASVPTRTWHCDNYSKLFEKVNAIYEDNVKFLILGGDDAAEEFRKSGIHADNVVNFAGRTSLEETAAIMSKSDLYIGSNTGLMHMASAFGVPSITIYAELEDGFDTDGDSPVKMGAWKTDSISLIPPAGLDGCYRVCRMSYSHCINQITPDKVLDEMKRYIKER